METDDEVVMVPEDKEPVGVPEEIASHLLVLILYPAIVKLAIEVVNSLMLLHQISVIVGLSPFTTQYPKVGIANIVGARISPIVVGETA